MNKKSLVCNLFIVILELIGLVVAISINKTIGIEYYTSDSNILALVSSSLFIIYIILKKNIPKWLQVLKYMTTVCLAVTFLVVILVLAPMYNFNYEYLLFNNSLLYQHLLCPVLSLVTFIFFDDISVLKKKNTYLGIIFTIIYAVVLILLNYLKLIEGPYPFLLVYEQSIFMSIFWIILILGMAYLVALLLRKIYVRIHEISDKN